ncbi:MAG: hypothetical protein FJY56_04190 [Betaproteobacteria bacterium]|nr:hypothetical protein [Betaproteobacteria bacterium]
MTDDAQTLIARLIAERWLARDEPLARRVLVDEAFREEVERRLAACGLRLLDNPYATHIALGLAREAEEPVMSRNGQWLSSNLGLPRDGVALLVVLWALLILPKRERQLSRRDNSAAQQNDLFGLDKPIPTGEAVEGSVQESALLADFGKQLGGKMRVNVNLGVLSRHGFIERRNNVIYEGPMLDLALDHGVLAPRILDGALAQLLAARGAKTQEAADSGD